MAKQLEYADNSRRMMARGINQLADTVKVTLGPKGRNVILQQSFGSPTITKDGVTVAREIDLKGPVREHGCPDGPRGRQQDIRHCRRWDDDGDGAGSGDLSRWREERRGWGKPDGDQAWHRARRGGGG